MWEYALHDRASDLAKKEAVFQLIIAGQSESLFSAGKEITRKTPELLNDDVSQFELIEFSATYSPFDARFESWGFCFKNKLCDETLTMLYICDNLINYDSFVKDIRVKLKAKVRTIGNGYLYLLKECRLNKN